MKASEIKEGRWYTDGKELRAVLGVLIDGDVRYFDVELCELMLWPAERFARWAKREVPPPKASGSGS